MGFETTAINYLFYAKKKGLSFGKTLMIGRQSYQLDKSYLKRCFRQNGQDPDIVDELLRKDDEYVEPFLQFLGATDVESVDASDYENATHVYDLNKPVPESMYQQYDLVIDTGTFEHIFNFPVAISSAMNMVKPGGHLISITPANNFFGHGFYQFSPELFYRVLSPENGFSMVNVFFHAFEPFAKWYDVSDPMAVKGRVALENARPSSLIVMAKKTAHVPLFEKMPQQSDYEHISWQSTGRKNPVAGSKSMLKSLPFPLRKAAYAIKYFVTGKRLRLLTNDFGSGNRKFFKKVKR